MNISWVNIKFGDSCSGQTVNWTTYRYTWSEKYKTWDISIDANDTIYITIWHENNTNTTKDYSLDLNFIKN